MIICSRVLMFMEFPLCNQSAAGFCLAHKGREPSCILQGMQDSRNRNIVMAEFILYLKEYNFFSKDIIIQFSSIGNGCSPLLGTTAGHPCGNAFKSPIWGVAASTEQLRSMRHPKHQGHMSTHEYKKGLSPQSTIVLSRLINTCHNRTLRV